MPDAARRGGPGRRGRPGRWGVAAEIAGTLAVAGGAGWAIYRERATVSAGLRVMAVRTEPTWIIACIGVQCLSMVFFALLQQQLLKAGGARLTIPWLLSTAYLANAVAVAVPVIGLGMAATFAYRQLRERRVDPVIAQAALVLAGVVSTVTFTAVVVAGAVLSGSPLAAASALGSALTCPVILAAAAIALRSAAGRSRLQRLVTRLLAAAQRLARHPRGDPGSAASGWARPPSGRRSPGGRSTRPPTRAA